MEQERLARESEELEKAERMKKIKEQFNDPNSQWEKDKTDIQNMAMLEKAKEQQAVGEDFAVGAVVQNEESEAVNSKNTVGL